MTVLPGRASAWPIPELYCNNSTRAETERMLKEGMQPWESMAVVLKRIRQENIFGRSDVIQFIHLF